MLVAAAADAEKLGDCRFQTSQLFIPVVVETAQVDDVLYGSFAKGGFADDDAAAVVLNSASKDFRGGGTVAIHQHSERTLVEQLGIRILIDFDDGRLESLVWTMGPPADKQAGQFERLGQGAATVTSQIDDKTIDILCSYSPVINSRTSRRCAAVVLFTTLSGAAKSI
ncbi:MAG: hypothetical protein U5P41_16225 [Gammaproteobacteria bacterium]|nr:hypothetical protein [Gammaproteobacteria bacterium]